MRIRPRRLIIVALVAVIAAGPTYWRPVLQKWWATLMPAVPQATTASRSDSSTTIVYRVDRTDWTEFILPPNPNMLRIMTNACLAPDSVGLSENEPDSEWAYQLQYELLDTNDQILESSTYHFRSRPSFGFLSSTDSVTAADNEAGRQTSSKPVNAWFFDGADEVPTSSRQMLIGLERLNRLPTKLRLKMVADNTDVRGIVVRCSCDSIVPSHKLPYRWTRMSPLRRLELSRGAVYPATLLTDAEKLDYVRHQWTPMAPTGLEGRNYERRRLCHYSDFVEITGQERLSTQLPSPAADTIATMVTVPIPDEPGQLKLHVEGRDEMAERAELYSMAVAWHSLQSSVPQTFHFLVDGSAADFVLPVRGGILAVSAAIPLRVRAEWLPADALDVAAQDITPQPTRVRGYVITPEQSVTYRLVHATAAATPLRITARRLIGYDISSDSAEAEPSSRQTDGALSDLLSHSALSPSDFEPTIKWQLLTDDGTEVAAGCVTIAQPQTNLDKVSSEINAGLSEPQQFYLAVPADASTIILASTSPLLLHASTRPTDLPRTSQVSADTSDVQDISDASRTWFLLRPENHTVLFESARSGIIASQSRPPEIKPEVEDGTYEWHDYQPGDRWIARYLLVPRDNSQPFRVQAAGTTFSKIDMNSDHDVQLLSASGEESTAPQLAFDRPNSEPTVIRIQIDNQLIHETQLLVRRGILQLPDVRATPGHRSTIRIETTSPMIVGMNCLLPEERQAWTKRLATRFMDDQLVFDFDKQNDERETVSLQLFRSHSAESTTRLRVRLLRLLEEAEDGTDEFTSNDRWQLVGLHDTGQLRRPSESALAFDDWTIPETLFEVSKIESDAVIPLGLESGTVMSCGTCFVKLGSDLPAGSYRIQVARESGSAEYVTCTSISPEAAELIETGAWTSTAFAVTESAVPESPHSATLAE